MPEGDTIWRTAQALHAALSGRRVIGFGSEVLAVARAATRLGVLGRSVERVDAVGKHLLVRFSGGPVLHTHQRMSGSWNLYRRRASPPGTASRVRVVIETDEVVAVCLRSPVVELLSRREIAHHPALSRLGPDLLADGFDRVLARARLRARADLEVGAALMDQTVMAGIGNVYKSEILFACGVSPFALVGELDDAVLDRLIATARDLMRRNLGSGPRRTTSPLASAPLGVYGRAGRPCPRCGSPISRARQGEPARSTWWCPGCQPRRGPRPPE